MNAEGSSNGIRWLTLALGGVALIAAIVALVLTLNDDDESATQTQVDDSVATLDKRLDKIEGTAVAAGDEGKKAKRRLSKAEKKAKGKQAKSDQQIDDLSRQVKSLEDKVDALGKQEAAQQQQIKQLKKDVKKLK